MGKQTTIRKQQRRPHTQEERDKIKNQALLREERKRQARRPTVSYETITGLAQPITGTVEVASGYRAGNDQSSEEKLTPKKIRQVGPVIYRPDARPNFAGTVAEPTFVVTVDSGPERPDSNLQALVESVKSFFGGDSTGMRFRGGR